MIKKNSYYLYKCDNDYTLIFRYIVVKNTAGASELAQTYDGAYFEKYRNRGVYPADQIHIVSNSTCLFRSTFASIQSARVSWNKNLRQGYMPVENEQRENGFPEGAL